MTPEQVREAAKIIDVLFRVDNVRKNAQGSDKVEWHFSSLAGRSVATVTLDDDTARIMILAAVMALRTKFRALGGELPDDER